MKARLPLISLFALLVLSALPISTQAAKLDLYNPKKKYGDEKITINNTASRCTGAAFKTLHSKAEIQAKKDLAKLIDQDGNVSKTVADAFKIYAQDIALGWAAMEEPYCGFGAFGSTAAKKSFNKTITRARADFLAKSAKKKTDDPKVSANSLSLLPSSTTSAVTTASTEAAPAAASETVPATVPVAVPESKPAPNAASEVAVNITRTLKRGDKTAEVKRLQQWLAKNGYLSADSATGYFGPQTEKAVIAFQKAKKLITSNKSSGAGLVGPKTRRMISE